MLNENEKALLLLRRNQIRDWLDDQAPYTMAAQRHLDACTPERAYWHHGYQAALTDVMALLGLPLQKSGSAGTPSPCRKGARDVRRSPEG
jgi:hypothetical protein